VGRAMMRAGKERQGGDGEKAIPVRLLLLTMPALLHTSEACLQDRIAIAGARAGGRVVVGKEGGGRGVWCVGKGGQRMVGGEGDSAILCLFARGVKQGP